MIAAKPNKIKIRDSNSMPPVISEKARGSVRKIKPGPSVGARLLSITIGNITNPAKRAISVSQKMIVNEVLTIDSFLGK